MPEPLPTVAPTAEISLFGETRILKYGFRAYNELGFNPYDKESIDALKGQKRTPWDLAKQIWAGLLHEYYGRGATRKGETPPTVDDVMDELDAFNYIDIWMRVQKAMGVDDDAEAVPIEDGAEQPPDPPNA